MANPPFNIKDWWHASLESDDTLKAWHTATRQCQLCLDAAHAAPSITNGQYGTLLANGSMSSNTNNEGEIRKKSD